jgi:hypothetical protein
LAAIEAGKDLAIATKRSGDGRRIVMAAAAQKA